MKLTQTITFEHETMGQQVFELERGRFTPSEVLQEIQAFKNAGWKLQLESGDDDYYVWDFYSGIVRLTVETERE